MLLFVGFSADGADGGARGGRAAPRWAGRSSRRRCSAWSPRSSPAGWPRRCATRWARWARSCSSRRPTGRCSASGGSPTRSARNRQIPSLLSRLDDHPLHALRDDRDRGGDRLRARARRATSSSSPGIFAFGAMLAFTLAHLSVIVLRFREPDRPRPFRVPLSVPVGRGAIPLPAALGALLGRGGLGERRRPPRGRAGRGRGLDGRRARALRDLPARPGASRSPSASRSPRRRCARPRTPRTAASWCRSSASRSTTTSWAPRAGWPPRTRAREEGGAVLEALYVLRDPDVAADRRARARRPGASGARRALARAKEVGEEYEGVEVATAMVRGRTVGLGDRDRGPAAGSGGDRAGRRGAEPHPRRRRCSAAGPRPRALRGRDHPLRDRKGALQGDPHRAAGRTATPGPGETAERPA